MRRFFLCAVVALAMVPPGAGQSSSSSQLAPQKAPSSTDLNDLFQAKIKSEWEAIKNKDKKAYGDLLADDYEGVEIDGSGERTRVQAMNELVNGNVANYTLWGFRVTPVGSEGVFVIYEVTLQFPPRSVLRYSRVYIGELWVKRADEWKLLHYQETHVK